MRGVYSLRLLFVLLLDDHVQFVFLLRQVVGQEHLESHLHALARRFVDPLYELLRVLPSEHVVDLVDVGSVLGREFGVAVFLFDHRHFGLDPFDLHSLAFLHGLDDHEQEISVAV